MATPTPDGNGWVMRAYVKPFVLWIWIGTVLMSVGGLFAAGDRRYRSAGREGGKHA